MNINKIIAITFLTISGSPSAELIATSSGPVILNISDLVVDLYDTRPQNSICEGYSDSHQANFYFFFHADNRKEKIATGCWVKNDGKISLFGEKLKTNEKFNYDQDVSEFNIIKSLDVVKDEASLAEKTENNANGNKIPKIYQIAFSGDFVQYPKGATQATLEYYIPKLQCQDFMDNIVCVSEPDALATIFIRGINCNQSSEIMFTLEQGKTVGASCGIDNETAESLSIRYIAKYGSPQKERNQMDNMVSDQQTWFIGNESHIIAHWSGKNSNDVTLNKYTVSIGNK